MRRPVLLTLAAVGGAIVLLGGTGIFAALSDTARSGTNSVESDALAGSSDLRVATAFEDESHSSIVCEAFSEDLTSHVMTIVGPPGVNGGEPYLYCVRNVGSQTVTLTVLAENLSDIDVDCTGDESVYDTSCGSGLGELGEFIQVEHTRIDCVPSPYIVESTNVYLLRDTTTTPSLGALAPGETRCFRATIVQSSATEAQRQAAQSDRLTWRFAWTGQA